MDESLQSLELREPTSPENLIPATSYTPWIISGAILLIVLLAAYIILRRKITTAAPDLAALRRAAYLDAGTELEKISTAVPREAAVQCSLIIRRYLARAAGDPALFETHEEFITRRDSLSALSPAAREACSSGFTRLAALKYAPEPPHAEPAAIVAESRALLETLHHGFQAS